MVEGTRVKYKIIYDKNAHDKKYAKELKDDGWLQRPNKNTYFTENYYLADTALKTGEAPFCYTENMHWDIMNFPCRVWKITEHITIEELN